MITGSIYFQSEHSAKHIGECIELVIGMGLSVQEVAVSEGCSEIALEMWIKEITVFKKKRIKCTHIEVRESRINTCF